MNKSSVIVGMSGGVDSSVAADLLLHAGHHVEGLFMKNWEEDDSPEYCTAAEDLADAEQVCEMLGIRLHTVNFSSEYWDRVFEYFLSEYRAGRTPNPDIMCNKEIKFRAFLDHALSLGADFIATGHYARIGKNGDQFTLLKGMDTNKDQSYFLYTLGQAQLSRTLFPIGELEKNEVRKIAAERGFANSQKKDSTGICFIGERNFRDFLQRYIPAQPGPMRTPDGIGMGTHQGLMFYTLGQRQGLGIGGQKDSTEEPWYVVEKDIENNTLIVAQGHDHPLLFHREMDAVHLHWVSGKLPEKPFSCMAKTRYRQADQACSVTPENDRLWHVRFEHPQRALTPGQSVVFYMDDCCLGGGIIEKYHGGV